MCPTLTQSPSPPPTRSQPSGAGFRVLLQLNEHFNAHVMPEHKTTYNYFCAGGCLVVRKPIPLAPERIDLDNTNIRHVVIMHKILVLIQSTRSRRLSLLHCNAEGASLQCSAGHLLMEGKSRRLHMKAHTQPDGQLASEVLRIASLEHHTQMHTCTTSAWPMTPRTQA